MAAHSLNRVGAPLGDWFRRLRGTLGPAGAVTAAAPKLARILYTLIKTRAAFDPTKLGNSALIHQRNERSLRKPAALPASRSNQPMQVLSLERGAEPRPRFYSLH